MRILFVGEVGSLHTVRWVNQLCGLPWDVHIFQADIANEFVRSDLRCGTVYCPYETKVPLGVTLRTTISRPGASLVAKAARKVQCLLPGGPTAVHVRALASLVRQMCPDVIHSLGLNIGWKNMCASVVRARALLGGHLGAPWIYSSWGADLVHYARLSPSHRSEVVEVMHGCDFYVAECERDENLAKNLGFSGEVLERFPVFGGVTWLSDKSLCQDGRTSDRRLIVLKGRDSGANGDPQGRAITAMKAFEMCADVLVGRRIAIVQPTATVRRAAVQLKNSAGLDIVLYDDGLPHKEVLRLLGAARIMLAVTVTDGLPSTLVEAMSLGAFPVHSDLGPIREWIEDGKNGLLVDPESPEAVAAAIRRAVSDDELVDRGSDINSRIVRERLSDEVIRPRVLGMYEYVAARKSRHDRRAQRGGR